MPLPRDKFHYWDPNTLNQLNIIIEYSKISKVHPDTRELKPDQRKCFLPGEGHLKITSHYSKDMCELEIKMTNLLAKCGCLPHYVDYEKRKKIT